MKHVTFIMGKCDILTSKCKSISCKRFFMVWWFSQKRKEWNIKL